MRPGEPRSTAPVTPQQLAVMRGALLTGVLLFGAVTWFMHRGGARAADSGTAEALRLLVPALAVGAVVAAFVVRGALAPITDAARRPGLKLLAWAVGEGAALAGGVHYFLSGDPRLYAVGVAAMVATFIVVPARDG